MNKYKYLFRSFLHSLSEKKCPYCGSKINTVIDRKYIVTTLNRCAECHLYFRHPPDSTAFNKNFYQKEYKQDNDLTTDLPDDIQLRNLLSDNFRGSNKDLSYKIDILNKIGHHKPLKLIDYGASWGYTSFQFLKAGFSVQAYEISRPRAAFGQKLGINILTEESLLAGDVDIFFNSHVIEHVPDIKHLFLTARQLLTEDGYFVAYCPNGSKEFETRNPYVFHKFWGQVHPNFLNAAFFSKAFRDVPFLIGSNESDTKEIENWDSSSQKILNVSGDELFVFAKIKKQQF
jgi:2-polyprenyl-3-methyl-5-hydroxy-6-metoxy-1,4-benzoquinol methylase